MMEPLDIAEQLRARYGQTLKSEAAKDNCLALSGKNVVITAGPTVEPIDPVRFISNHSSGKMGYALAASAAEMGANVTLISGPVSLKQPSNVITRSVKTADEMLQAVKSEISQCDVFIGCAAVADYTPATVAEQKIKKNEDSMRISLVKNPDIISWVAEQAARPLIVGFAAESHNLKEFATQKLSRKKLDMICANNISNKELGFNSDNNEILILNSKGEETLLPAASKTSIAKSILEQINKQFLID